MSAQRGVLAVIDAIEDAAHALNRHPYARERDALLEAHAAVAELVEADKEYDAALTALTDLNRRIAEQGWMEVEFDALRKSGERFVRARIARAAALARMDPQPGEGT